MKILLAIQGTGNGHISRARDIIPYLQQYGELDIAISGTQADVSLSQPVNYKFHGFSFIFGRKGGVDQWLTYKAMNLPVLLRDIRTFPAERYDLIINDFEPVTAWACKLKKIPCIALSHQSSFLSKKTPRPEGKWNWAELILSHYAPSTHAVGFHFERYDDFIHTPVIRKEIRTLAPENKGHYTVYLPAYDDPMLLSYLSQLPDTRWEVFSKHCDKPYTQGNISVRPIDNHLYNVSVSTCEGLLTGGGFEGPAEALFLGKKILAIPMTGQWEQQCNAEAMRRFGIPVVPLIGPGFEKTLEDWVYRQKAIQVVFPDETEQIVHDLVKKYAKNA